MTKPLFDIQNLKCAYPPKKGDSGPPKVAFSCDKLEIERGKIIIILGLSGSGKSTFLETLGLMTETIQDGSTITFTPLEGGVSYDLRELWKDEKNAGTSNLTKIRKENFNFIFQDTNLMPHLSNINNVSLADLNGNDQKSLEQVRLNSSRSLQKMSLPMKALNKSPKNISGGERQRVAFARAIQPEFKVLFGDEPTGNLDDNNARELMWKIYGAIHPQEYLNKRLSEFLIKYSDLSQLSTILDCLIDLKNAIETEVNKEKCDSNTIALKIKEIREDFENNNEVFETLRKQDNKQEIKRDLIDLIHASETVLDRIEKNSINDRTAIIVSHNLQLAVDFADQIMVLSSENEHFTIKPENIYSKNVNNEWINITNHRRFSNKDFVKSVQEILENSHKFQNHHLEPTIPKMIEQSLFSNLCICSYMFFRKMLPSFNINNEFIKLFFAKEGRYFLGKNFIFFWLYFIILSLVYLVIGSANGSLKSLETKLKDPFINAIEVKHKGGDQSKIQSYIGSLLENDSLKLAYNLDTIYHFNSFKFPIKIADSKKKQYLLKARTMLYNDPTLEKILDPAKNDAVYSNYQSINDYGVVVTRNILKKLNYDTLTPWVFITTNFKGKNRSIPLPVKAIVKKLPGVCETQDLLMLPNLYTNWKKFNNQLLIGTSEGYERLYLLANIDEENEQDFPRMLKVAINATGDDSSCYKIESVKHNYSYKTLYQFIIRNECNEFIDLVETDRFYQKLTKTESFKNYLINNHLDTNDIVQTYQENYNYNINRNNQQFDKIEILMKNPDNIRSFSKDFESATGLDINMITVENLETFHWISFRTKVLLFLLIALSTYAIYQFIYHIFNFSLFRIRKNIGTLKAFGINVKTVYISLLFTFILSGLIASLGISSLIGYFFINILLWNFSLFGNGLEWIFLISPIVALIGVTLYVIYKTNKKYFRQSPGDLIYDRIDEEQIDDDEL